MNKCGSVIPAKKSATQINLFLETFQCLIIIELFKILKKNVMNEINDC